MTLLRIGHGSGFAVGIVAILAPAIWLLRRWSGRQALMVVTAPSGVVVQTPLTAEGRTVARRREAVAALIRRGAVTDPDHPAATTHPGGVRGSAVRR